ncbi:MAG TPA: CBS domain-containing protein [Thermoplasmata archaeon]|nr:CBS domain-containing protein [Thermoplasmata archaeon]
MVLTIKEVMDTRFLAVEPSLTALEGAKRMVEGRHGYLLLVRDGRPEGIVTEWDYIERVVAAERAPGSVTLDSIASRPVTSCDAGTPTSEVIDLMVEKGVRRIVITQAGQVVGVVGSKDVLRSFRAYVDRISSDIARLQSSFP